MSFSRDCWDCFWRKRVNSNAAMSTCASRAVGAVVVDKDNRTIADGFNGNLPGWTHCVDGGCLRCSRPGRSTGEDLETCYCVHAEANIVSYCARKGVSMNDTTIYLTISPCLECFKLLVSSGIVEIVFQNYYPTSQILKQIPETEQMPTIRMFDCQCNKELKKEGDFNPCK